MSAHFITNTASGHSPLDLTEKSKRYPHPISCLFFGHFFGWSATLLPFLYRFFQERRKAKRVKKMERKVTWQHRKRQTEHYGMPAFFFLEKRKNAGQASGLHHLVASSAAPASIHSRRPSTHTHTHARTHTHTHKHTQTICHTFTHANWL